MAIDSILLAGSGAVENAWDPVFRAITKVRTKVTDDIECANLFMARLVFDARFFANAAENARMKGSDSYAVPEKAAKLNLQLFRSCLASELSQSVRTTKLQLRKEQLAEVKSLLRGETSLVTTNWELDSFKPINPHHSIALHGEIENPNSLYLPAETSFDRNVNDENGVTHTNNHHNAMSHLESAHTIVLWGLGLNALDAELSVVFSEAFHYKNINETEYEIYIFDLNPEIVAKKLSLFGADFKQMKLIKVT